ncbi:MAG: DUF721 domain-containing protein [Myxococcales bacterium]|nr:DUF721 domain-containing protein [Myxococcales bacterium]
MQTRRTASVHRVHPTSPKADPMALGDVLDLLIDEVGRGPELNDPTRTLASLQAFWPRLVGVNLARVSSPSAIRPDGVVVISTVDSFVPAMATFHRLITRRLTQFSPRLRGVSFIPGAVARELGSVDAEASIREPESATLEEAIERLVSVRSAAGPSASPSAGPSPDLARRSM